MEAVKEIVSKLVESISALLIVLGVILLALGFAGGITYNHWFPITGMDGKYGAIVAGTALTILGVFNRKSNGSIPQARRYDIKIDYPKEGDSVDIIDVRGSIKLPLPEGYTLKIFRIYPGSDTLVPVGEGRVNNETKTWVAENCNVGGISGDRRSLGAFLVGPGGKALLNYFSSALDTHQEVLEELKQKAQIQGKYLPAIQERTPDMIECHRVSVRKKVNAAISPKFLMLRGIGV